MGDPHGSESRHREAGHGELLLACAAEMSGRGRRRCGGMHADARLMFGPAEHAHSGSTGVRWPDHTIAGKRAVDPTLVHRYRRAGAPGLRAAADQRRSGGRHPRLTRGAQCRFGRHADLSDRRLAAGGDIAGRIPGHADRPAATVVGRRGVAGHSAWRHCGPGSDHAPADDRSPGRYPVVRRRVDLHRAGRAGGSAAAGRRQPPAGRAGLGRARQLL